jgi:hippurate hydrolase
MNPSDFLVAAHALLPQVKAWREAIHADPELSFQEERTKEKVLSYLPTGWEIQTWQSHHGLLVSKTGRPGSGRRVGIRAELDALPIDEKTQASYASKHAGRMHACGHDVHTACLLGAMHLLSNLKEEWQGDVLAVFQPAEEQLPGGGKMMLEQGLFAENRPDVLIGMHVFPEMQVGAVGFRPGPYMASTDELWISVQGRGGHAALMRQNENALAAASALVSRVYALGETMSTPEEPIVASIGWFQGLGSTNVIPAQVELKGTLRCLTPERRSLAHQALQKLAVDLDVEFGTQTHIDIRSGYPPLVNSVEWTAWASLKAGEMLGPQNSRELPIRMTADDFAWYAPVAPLVYFRLGTASANGEHAFSVHDARFDIDPESLVVGTAMLAWLAYSACRSV